MVEPKPPAIDAAMIDAAASWMLGDSSSGDGSRLDEWARARSVDLTAICEFAREEAQATLEWSTGTVGRGGLRVAIQQIIVQGFITGVEAERLRRDSETLPDPQPLPDSGGDGE